MLEEFKGLNKKIEKFDSDVATRKHQHLIIYLVSCLYWANAQYSSRECLWVAGLHKSLLNEEIEMKVCSLFQKLVCDRNKTIWMPATD